MTDQKNSKTHLVSLEDIQDELADDVFHMDETQLRGEMLSMGLDYDASVAEGEQVLERAIANAKKFGQIHCTECNDEGHHTLLISTVTCNACEGRSAKMKVTPTTTKTKIIPTKDDCQRYIVRREYCRESVPDSDEWCRPCLRAELASLHERIDGLENQIDEQNDYIDCMRDE